MSNQASEDELQPFTSLFQNAAAARDYVPGCISEEDINELAAHIFFIEPTYKYDTSKEPIDNVFSAYRIAIQDLLRTEKLKLLAEVKSSLTRMKELKENRDNKGVLWGSYDVVDLDDIREVLNKLEAEL